MCGIVGFVGQGPAAARIMDALNRLEYRGYDSAQEVIARDGRTTLLTDHKGAGLASPASLATLVVPDMPTLVAPLVFALPLQLLAYHTALIRGADVDQPRNLAKSVTVE
jgi:glutamine---fructose-6-phosphate transaminase (isomerizing)